MITRLENKQRVLFVDEAVFTTNQSVSDVWWKSGTTPPSKNVNALSFSAVAVVAAIDVEGRLISYLIKEFSIKKEDFIEFLDLTKYMTCSGESYILLDNLRAHHSLAVK